LMEKELDLFGLAPFFSWVYLGLKWN